MTTDEIELLPISIGLFAAHNCNGLLEPYFADIGNDDLPFTHTARSGICNVNLVDWNPFNVLFLHASSLVRTLRHLHKEVQIVAAINIQEQAVFWPEGQSLSEDIKARQEVVIKDVVIARAEASCNYNVWAQTLVKSKLPPQVSCSTLPASCKDQGCCVFGVDREQVVALIDANRSSEGQDLVKYGGNQIGMSPAELAIDFDICVVPIGGPTNEAYAR